MIFKMVFDMEIVSHFHFLRPWWLLTIVSAFFFKRYFFGRQNINARWQKVIAPHLFTHLIVTGGKGKRVRPENAFFFASIIAAIAMAGPSWQRSNSPFAEDQAPLAIVLDLSRSMGQTDIAPSRVERAKQKIHDLLKLRPGAKNGLIVYAGSSHTVIPLTNDPGVLENLLFSVQTDIMPLPGKSLSHAVPLVEKMLGKILCPATILVISDAATVSGIAAFSAHCAASDHQLIVYGIGLERGEKGNSENAGEDVFGEAFIPLAKKSLKDLARRCDGIYLETTPDKTDVEKIARHIDTHFISAEDSARPWIDAGYPLLFPLAAVFVFWFRRGWTLTWSLAAVIVLLSGNMHPIHAGDHFILNLWLTPDQQGRFYFEKGAYLEAANRFKDPLWKGTAFYMNENFEAAAEIFSQIETPEGLFNLGNALAHGRHYGRALETYDRLLAILPDHADAKKNRQIIYRIIEQINRATDFQAVEEGESREKLNYGPLPAGKTKKEDSEDQALEQYTAQQILSDPHLQELWMRQVQQDPGRFLAMKFQMQIHQEDHEKAHE